MARQNDQEALAREAAAKIDRARELGEQLTFLPDEAGGGPVATLDRPSGGRGPGKAQSQLRAYLAHRGLRQPEEVLAEIAGLATRDDAITAAMASAERILAWAADGDGPAPTAKARLATFAQCYTMQLRAAEALLPYGMPKAAGNDEPAGVTNQILVVSRPSSAAQAADPGGDAAPSGARRMIPADMRRNEGNQ